MTIFYPSLLVLEFSSPANHNTGTEAQWTALLGESGFKIVQIYHHGLGAESVIEAEIA